MTDQDHVLDNDVDQAIEDFIASTQWRIRRLMQAKDVNQAELARRLDLTQARISQLFGDHSNITLQTIARIFHSLGEKPLLSSPTLDTVLAAIHTAAKARFVAHDARLPDDVKASQPKKGMAKAVLASKKPTGWSEEIANDDRPTGDFLIKKA